MRWILVGWVTVLVMSQTSVAQAEDERRTGERVIGGVISGLLGGPQPMPDAAYAAQERERLASMLQGGEYVTSRQGEPVDLVVAGVPLTRTDHVYTAKPIPPSHTYAPQGVSQ